MGKDKSDLALDLIHKVEKDGLRKYYFSIDGYPWICKIERTDEQQSPKGVEQE